MRASACDVPNDVILLVLDQLRTPEELAAVAVAVGGRWRRLAEERQAWHAFFRDTYARRCYAVPSSGMVYLDAALDVLALSERTWRSAMQSYAGRERASARALELSPSSRRAYHHAKKHDTSRIAVYYSAPLVIAMRKHGTLGALRVASHAARNAWWMRTLFGARRAVAVDENEDETEDDERSKRGGGGGGGADSSMGARQKRYFELKRHLRGVGVPAPCIDAECCRRYVLGDTSFSNGRNVAAFIARQTVRALDADASARIRDAHVEALASVGLWNEEEMLFPENLARSLQQLVVCGRLRGGDPKSRSPPLPLLQLSELAPAQLARERALAAHARECVIAPSLRAAVSRRAPIESVPLLLRGEFAELAARLPTSAACVAYCAKPAWLRRDIAAEAAVEACPCRACSAENLRASDERVRALLRCHAHVLTDTERAMGMQYARSAWMRPCLVEFVHRVLLVDGEMGGAQSAFWRLPRVTRFHGEHVHFLQSWRYIAHRAVVLHAARRVAAMVDAPTTAMERPGEDDEVPRMMRADWCHAWRFFTRCRRPRCRRPRKRRRGCVHARAPE